VSAPEWKPGDVALVTPNANRQARCVSLRRDDGWVCQHRASLTDGEVRDARPLVVIDPEDREQVERLVDALLTANAFGSPFDDVRADRVQQALRSLIAPPRPEGLGAVVEDAEGEKWVWLAQGAEGAHWHRVGFPEKRANWHQIAAVSVLSEGWRADA
jgi:hypothetical protein